MPTVRCRVGSFALGRPLVLISFVMAFFLTASGCAPDDPSSLVGMKAAALVAADGGQALDGALPPSDELELDETTIEYFSLGAPQYSSETEPDESILAASSDGGTEMDAGQSDPGVYPPPSRAQRADTFATLTAGDEFELEIRTCSNSATPLLNDFAYVTMQVGGEAFAWNLSGTRQPNSISKNSFEWPGSSGLQNLQALKIELRGSGSWCINRIVLRWFGDNRESINAPQELWTWTSSVTQPGSYTYLHGHSPSAQPITLDNDKTTARAAFVRFTLLTADYQVTTSPRRCLGSATESLREPRGFCVKTCNTANAGSSPVGVAVKHDNLWDFLVVKGTLTQNEVATVSFNNFCAIRNLQSVRLQAPTANTWSVCETYFHDYSPVVLFAPPQETSKFAAAAAAIDDATCTTGYGFYPLWTSGTTARTTSSTTGFYTYTVNQNIDPCTTCVTARQGFELALSPRVRACLAGTNPLDNTCNGIDDDCDGVVDDEWQSSSSLSCVGECRYRSTCTNGVVACGIPTPEIPGNGKNEDCDTRTDEAGPRGACTADLKCDVGLACHGGICLAPHCANGVRDTSFGETGTDCGGTDCKACDALSCDSTCRLGEPTTPPSTDYLSFASGTFSRASTATYVAANGVLESARANELRWANVDGPRLALFEGRATNKALYSESLDAYEAWYVPPSGMTRVVNAAVAPDGTQSAEILRSPSGPAYGPRQSFAALSAGHTLSFYARPTADVSDDLYKMRVVSELATGVPTASRTWDFVHNDWARYDMAIPASGAPRMGLSHPSGPSGSAIVAPEMSMWGVQLEEGAFPTSYVPTFGTESVRERDLLTIPSASVPAWIRTGIWQFDVVPLFASSEAFSDTRMHNLIEWSTGSTIALKGTGSGGTARLYLKYGTSTYQTQPFAWEREAKLRITINAQSDQVTIAGQATGTIVVAVPSLEFPVANLCIGGCTQSAFAAISEPRRVASATSTCVADPSCWCGDGVLRAGEVCDPGLTARCAADCKSNDLVTCGDDKDCPSGSVCGLGNGGAFGLHSSINVCWPSLCVASASDHCGDNAPCGTCTCDYDCSDAICGMSNPDGCGGTCPNVCGEGEAGGIADRDCGPGLSLGEGAGPAFGLAEGESACWPNICENPIQRRLNCGQGALCGLCLEEPNECDARVCGSDRFGHSCGTCSEGQRCDTEGRCVTTRKLTNSEPTPQTIRDAVHYPPPDLAGKIPGTFAVTDSGSANYTIPLDVPPGRAGLTPQVALHYLSASGDGSVGKGWSLSGLSSVHRCARTFAQHGESSGVRLSVNDAFCLDGQLLVQVGDNEYRTELDSYVRVRAFGQHFQQVAGGGMYYQGPTHFQVWMKDGKVFTYGTSAASRIEAKFDDPPNHRKETAVRVAWMLDSVTDTSGNKSRFYYRPEETNRNGFRYTGEIVPSRITYGDNESHAIVFDYQPNVHNTSVRSYRGGIGRHFSSPISKVSMMIDGAVVRYYKLESAMVGEQWMLDSVKLCTDSAGTERCLPETKFHYTPQDQELTLLKTTSDLAGHIPINPNYKGIDDEPWEPDNVNNWFVGAIDQDGDGRQDILHSLFEGRGAYLERQKAEQVDPIRMYLRKSKPLNGSSAFGAVGPTTGRSRCVMVAPLDFNHDGREDFVGNCFTSKYQNELETRLVMSAGDGFDVTPISDVIGPEPNGRPRHNIFSALDLDGDGRIDFLGCANRNGHDEMQFYRNGGANGFELAGTIDTHELGERPMNCRSPSFVFDHDGDGQANLILMDLNEDVDSDDPVSAFGLRFVGDELIADDLGVLPFSIPYKREATGWWQNDGSMQVITIGNFYDMKLKAIDANSDGLLDLVHLGADGIPELFLSTGRGFVHGSRAPGVKADYELFDFAAVIDSDSDGQAELFIPTTDNGWRVHAPYSHTSAGTGWRSRGTQMPYAYVHLTQDPLLGSTKHRRRHTYQSPYSFDWDGDGVMEVLIRSAPEGRPDDFLNPVFQLWKAGPRTQGLLSKIEDGLGKTVEITYSSKPTNYDSGSCAYPQQCLKKLPGPVVSAHTEYGASGAFADPQSRVSSSIALNYEYEYDDARVDLRGRGWLGFGRRVVREYASPGQMIKETTYTYDMTTHNGALNMYLFAGYEQNVETAIISRGNALNGPSDKVHKTRLENVWTVVYSDEGLPHVVLDHRNTRFLERGTSESQDRQVGLRVETFAYDEYGNTTVSHVAWDGGRSELTTSIYVKGDHPLWSTFEQKWLVGLLQSQIVTSVRGGQIKSHETRLTYEACGAEADGCGGSRGLPDRIERFLGGTSEHYSNFDYDIFGNEIATEQGGRNATAQTSSVVFDSRGLFPIETHNALHDSAQMEPTRLGIDMRSGEMQWTERPDGTWGVWNRDAFGRVVDSTDDGGNATTYSYEDPTGDTSRLRISRFGPGQPTVDTIYNAFGQVTQERTTEWVPQLQGTRTVVAETGYDERGRVAATAVPHLLGTPAAASHQLWYDDLGRLTKEEHPWVTPSGTATYAVTSHFWGSSAYAGSAGDSAPWSTVTDAVRAHRIEHVSSGTSTTEMADSSGDKVATVDAKGTITRFTFGAFNRVRAVTVAANEVVAFESDALGRVSSVTDYDAGSVQYSYDGLGLLRSKTQNGTLLASWQYDGLGRMRSAQTVDGHYEWQYDGTGADRSMVGHLETESVASATIGNSSIGYEYHAPTGSVSAIHRVIDGESFSTEVEPDSFGRPEVIHFPLTGPSALAIRYRYDPLHGRLTDVEPADGGQALWSLKEVDVFGNAVAVQRSNGTVVKHAFQPSTERLASIRVENLGGTLLTSQTLRYESRGLIDGKTLSSGGSSATETFVYDELGRIEEHHVPVGPAQLYEYDLRGNLKLAPGVGRLQYDDARSNLVDRTDDGRSFDYENGNQVKRTGTTIPGEQQSIEYTAFNLPRSVTMGSDEMAPVDSVQFHYDSSHRRVAQIWQDGTTVSYVGDLYQRTVSPGLDDQHVLRIPTPDGLVVEATVTGTSEPELRFIDTDHLGSTIGVRDDGSSVVEGRTYSPFGKLTSGTETTTRAGFTGHESDTRLGLINMRGRMYDPNLGRFLTPDPIVQSAESSQGWNPYAYVMNTPVNGIDPSGFEGEMSGGGGGGAPAIDLGAGHWVPHLVAYDQSDGSAVLIEEWEPVGELAAEPGFASAGNSAVGVAPGFGNKGGVSGSGSAGGGSSSGRSGSSLPKSGAAKTGADEVAGIGTAAAGVVGGALVGYGTVVVTSYLLGAFGAAVGAVAAYLGIASAAIAAPVAIFVGAAALTLYGLYQLWTHRNQIVESGRRLLRFEGRFEDYYLFGNFFGGGLAARRAAGITEYGRAVVEAEIATARQLGIINRIPNPWGRKGSPAHRAKVLEAEQRLGDKGYTRETGGTGKEEAVRLPNGKIRFPDLVMRTPNGARIAVQVGRLTARGRPVARERAAMSDLKSSGEFDNVFFVGY